MKKNFLFIAIAILVGLFLTVTQVFAAAPGISLSKKTPPPTNPSSEPATGIDKPKNENKGNGKPEKTGKPDDTGKPENTGKPEKTGKSDNTGKPEKKAKPVTLRGEIIGISDDAEAGTMEVSIQLQNGGEISFVVSDATKISVPTLKKTSPGAILAEGMQVVVKAHEDADKNLLADTIHVVPAAPLHIHNAGKVTAYVEGQSITIAKGEDEKTFTITGKTTILPKDATIKLGDWVTIISTTEETDNGYPAPDPDPSYPGPEDGDSGRTALAIVLLPGK